jgi:hypothetical protein
MGATALAAALGSAGLAGTVASACSDSTETTLPGTTGGNTGTAGGGGTTNASGGGGMLFVDGGDAGCAEGEACGDGGVCVGNGVCCSAIAVCGAQCCPSNAICSFQNCVMPGIECVDAADCGENEYCEYSLGEEQPGDAGTDAGSCQGGVQPRTGRCLPRPPECAPEQDPGDPPSCLHECEYVPATPQFSPVLQHSWGGQTTAPFSTDVMMMPIVVELDDDDCDGAVTARDIPEIVFTTFTGGAYTTAGTVHAIAIVNDVVVEKWAAPPAGFAISPAAQLAGGNFDGQPGNEVVGCGTDGYAHALRGADGSVLWASSVAVSCFMPSIADLDQDGQPEVIVEGGILDGLTGTLEHAFSAPMVGTFAVSDIDGDGELDVVSSSQAFHADGTLFINTAVGGNWNAIADLDLDGIPEVIGGDYANHVLNIWHVDSLAPSGFSFVRQGLDINGTLSPSLCPVASSGYTRGGGPPTVADFDGDGIPDVAQAGGIGYAVFNGAKLMDPAVANADVFLWQHQTQDCSSAATGSSVFDFDGDGKAEVVYSDENYLRIYEGPAPGNVLWQTCNTTGTLEENPVIADVDNDGQADIVVVSNAYASGSPSYQCEGTAQAGVRIFGDSGGNWVRSRRVWNEHAYHITNVGEDGSIPAVELPNWADPRLNNFRQNKQPLGEFSAPDLVVEVLPRCVGDYALIGRVRNIGEASVPEGVLVRFYLGAVADGNVLGEGVTTRLLYSLESEDVVLPLAAAPDGLVRAVVDDGFPPHPWHECRTDNNVSAAADVSCSVPR